MTNISLDDKVFKEVCELLSKNNINYWICHGTLLGIIREGRLLPWDHDIDFAVWQFEVSQEKIVDIFTSNGYVQELVFGDMDCLHFFGESKKIDISFYRVENNIASIRWVAPSKSILLNAYFYCIKVIWIESIQSINLSKNIFKKIIQILLNVPIMIVKCFLRKSTREKLYLHSTKFMRYTGYSYPLYMMNFIKINYSDSIIQIPKDSEKCMEMTYGKDWKIPKKKYVWHDEASNLF
jgi:hypothetical protein